MNRRPGTEPPAEAPNTRGPGRPVALRATLRLSPPRRVRLRRLRPLLLLSLALHLTALALLILRIIPLPSRKLALEPSPPADYAVVFESPSGPESVPEQVKKGRAQSPASTPQAAPPLSAPPPSPPAPTTPPTPPSQPAPAQPAPPQPSQAQPPAVQAPSPDQLRPPSPPQPPRQVARPAPRPPPSRPSPDFPMPMDFSLGPRPLQRPPERPGASTQQSYGPQPSFNAPVGEDKSGPSFLYDYKQISGPPLPQDWFGKLNSYWLLHRYYPPQAIANLEDGTAEIRIHVDPYGHVKETELVGRSGSIWLDGAAQSWIRDAHLQPFPPGSIGEDAVIDVRIQYIIIYARR